MPKKQEVQKNGRLVLVCGGRNYENKDHVFAVLDRLDAEDPIGSVLQGGATGGDRAAYLWAVSRGKTNYVERADWRAYGRAAGPMRNLKMIMSYPVDLVVAFPGGAGTMDMINKANQYGVPVSLETP